MPVTRSGAPAKHPRAAIIPHPRAKNPVSSSSEAEIIAINHGSSSSSMLNSNIFSSVPPRSGSMARAPKPKRRSNIIPQEVIEISSDDDDDEAPPARRVSVAPSGANNNDSVVGELRREIRKLKEDKEHLRHDAETLHRQLEANLRKVRSLEIQTSLGSDKVALDYSNLEDIISCNICTNTMFVPYIISECGHTFCQKCLTEWFDTSLRTFLIAHPNFNPNAPFPMPLLQVMAIPGAANDPRVRAYMQQHMPAQPQYSCPECRTAVKSAPVENFAMKSLSRMVTSARKEAIPSTPARPREGVWDGYFPVRRT